MSDKPLDCIGTDSGIGKHDFRLNIEKGETGLYYATSPDVKGLLAVGATSEEATTMVPDALAELYKAAQEEIAALKRERASFCQSIVVIHGFALKQRTDAILAYLEEKYPGLK